MHSAARSSWFSRRALIGKGQECFHPRYCERKKQKQRRQRNRNKAAAAKINAAAVFVDVLAAGYSTRGDRNCKRTPPRPSSPSSKICEKERAKILPNRFDLAMPFTDQSTGQAAGLWWLLKFAYSRSRRGNGSEAASQRTSNRANQNLTDGRTTLLPCLLACLRVDSQCQGDANYFDSKSQGYIFRHKYRWIKR